MLLFYEIYNIKCKIFKFLYIKKIYIVLKCFYSNNYLSTFDSQLIERLLRRQFLASKQVGDLRLKFIKVRDRVAEKQAALQALDKLGKNLRIIDYEQLKMENQSHADKIEERDEELTRLRFKCEKSIQILAHLREKSACTTIEIMDNNGRLREVEIECMEVII